MAKTNLTVYIISYMTPDMPHSIWEHNKNLFWQCSAEDEEHAMEQFHNAFPLAKQENWDILCETEADGWCLADADYEF